MKIVIYGINYWPELTGVGKYTGELGRSLSQAGHRVRVITAPPYYPEWKIKDGYKSWRYIKENESGVMIFRVPIYVPKKPTSITRLLHLISYSLSSLPIAIRLIFCKPDIVLFVQPTLFAAFGALILAKFSRARTLMHIQDYEIDAMFGLNMIRHGLLVKGIKKIENWLLGRFDMVSTISFSMMEKAKQKGVADSRLLLFPNWADTEFVTPSVDGMSIKSEWGFSKDNRIVLYAGNIGKKQGLELVLDVAHEFKDHISLQFVIVGTGAHVEVLKNDAAARSLDNVSFKPLQKWERVPEMLAMADVHLVIQKSGISDAVLPSKLTNILSSGGHAIVTAEKYTELSVLAEQFPGIYECVEPDNIEVLAESLRSLLDKNIEQPNQVARDYAVEYLTKNKVLTRFERNLKEITGSK